MMMDQALKVVEESAAAPPNQQFVWTLPGWPMNDICADWPGQSAARRQRIADAFRAGRFVVHALPFTLHTDLMEPEELGPLSSLSAAQVPLRPGLACRTQPRHLRAHRGIVG
jgi:hypothetical protein